MKEEYVYLDLRGDEGRAMLELAEEWLCAAYGSMANIDILDIYIYNEEAFADLNIFDSGRYYSSSRGIPDEWMRKHRRDQKIKEILDADEREKREGQNGQDRRA